MQSDICISVNGVSKKFARSLKRSFIYGARDVMGASIGRKPSSQLRPSEFWALRDISFQLIKGQAIGLIGLNGSGKTTLLRLVCGILKPTEGKVSVNGRIAPLLALGAGFQPVLAGRENIYLNMSLLGVPYGQITERFDEVVEFAGLHESIDAPVGTYSSGMRARLAFSCAVHTKPSILVVDEILSVGDAQFRAKCRNKINELRKNGTSMLLVSHSAVSIETICDHCIYLERGRQKLAGEPSEVMGQYDEDLLAITRTENAKRLGQDGDSGGAVDTSKVGNDAPLSLTELQFGTEDNPELGHLVNAENGIITARLKRLTQTMTGPFSVNFIIRAASSESHEFDDHIFMAREIGFADFTQEAAQIRLNLAPVILHPGEYFIKLSVSIGPMHDIAITVDKLKLTVAPPPGSRRRGFYQPHTWALEGATIVTEPDHQSAVDVESAEDF